MGPEKCLFCGQEIDSEATKCFFCGAELDEDSIAKRLEQLQIEDSKATVEKVKCPFGLQVIVFVLICIALFSGKSVRKSGLSKAGPPEGSEIRLNAKVTFTGAQFVIYNNDTFDWTNVDFRLTLEDAGDNFNLSVPIIPAGKKRIVRASEFISKNGSRFNPYTMKPKRFLVWCEAQDRKNGTYFAGWK